MNTEGKKSQNRLYEIKIRGRLNKRWAEWFAPLTLTSCFLMLYLVHCRILERGEKKEKKNAKKHKSLLCGLLIENVPPTYVF